jgi:predicted N-acetyltransferase YhbS
LGKSVEARQGSPPKNELKFEVRELSAEETHGLRRAVSADGRTDLSSMHYELDDATDSWHLGAVDSKGSVIAISSFYREPCPIRPDVLSAFVLQFMAVDPSVQRQGIGSAVLETAIRRLRSSGTTLLWANARDIAVPFYQRFGFSVAEESASTPTETGRPHHLIVLDMSP